MKTVWKYLLFLPMLAFMIACDDDDDNMDPDPDPMAPTLSAALDATTSLSTLEDAVGAVSGLVADLEGRSAITVFAPDNDAFTAALNAYGASNLTELTEAIGGPANLELLLGFHVVPATAFAEDLAEGPNTLTTIANQDLVVTKTGTTVTVDDGNGDAKTVTTADVAISNGVVHIINGVLVPEFPTPSIVEALQGTADLSLLLASVSAVDGLAATLEGATAITVFAPNNAAFTDLLDGRELSELITELGGIDSLAKVLQFHVVGATAFSGDLADGDQTFTTLAGEDIRVNKSADGVTVTDAAGNTYNVTMPDVAVDNGVVHIIDGVLLPTLTYPNIVDAAAANGLSTLLEAITAASLGTTLLEADEITVFAPKNEAFGPLLDRYGAEDLPDLIEILTLETVADVLKFHVIPSAIFSHNIEEGDQTVTTLEGQELTVNKSADGTVTITDYLNFTYTVEIADVVIDNGVVHVIDGVLLPDVSDEPNIVEAATEAGLSTLIDAVIAADLTNTLLQATDITVFAPDNAAFAALLAAQEVADLDALITKLGAPAVVEVLQFHVVPAVAFADDLQADQMFTTLSGEDLRVQKSGATVTITDAAGMMYDVTTADVTIENGVVHVIEGVLLPTLDD